MDNIHPNFAWLATGLAEPPLIGRPVFEPYKKPRLCAHKDQIRLHEVFVLVNTKTEEVIPWLKDPELHQLMIECDRCRPYSNLIDIRRTA